MEGGGSKKATEDESMEIEGGESSEGDEFSGSEEEAQAEAMVEGEDLAHQVRIVM